MSESVRVHDDVSTLLGDAVSWFLATLERAQREGRTVHVALTGGSLSDPFHAEVVRRSQHAQIAWSEVHWWWGDDRFVEAASKDRNAGQAMASLLRPLGVSEDHVHTMASSDEAADTSAAAQRYAAELDGLAPDGFEVVLLGMGPDGHVASLFPGHASLEVSDRWAIGEDASPKPPSRRVSLTLAALNRARAVAFLVAGADKADAVAASRSSGAVAQCPARGVRGREETVWFLDTAAAASIESDDQGL